MLGNKSILVFLPKEFQKVSIEQHRFKTRTQLSALNFLYLYDLGEICGVDFDDESGLERN